MTKVYLGLGSNIEPEHNLAAGIARLTQTYKVECISPWYRSPAMGFDGPDFINLALMLECDDDPETLSVFLKQLEAEFGRAPDAVKYSSRALDIDILLFGNCVGEIAGLQLPRADIRTCAFVLRPLLDIHPHGIDPQTGEPLADYWPALAEQPLFPIGR